MIDDELMEFFRRHKKVTQAQLAKASKLATSTISRYRWDPFHKHQPATVKKIRTGMAKFEKKRIDLSLVVEAIFILFFIAFIFWLG